MINEKKKKNAWIIIETLYVREQVPVCPYMEVSCPYKAFFRSPCEKLNGVFDILD